MASINQVIRERKKFIRLLKTKLKAVDSALEIMERKQNQILSRKSKVPEQEDLRFLAQKARDLESGLRGYLGVLRVGFAV